MTVGAKMSKYGPIFRYWATVTWKACNRELKKTGKIKFFQNIGKLIIEIKFPFSPRFNKPQNGLSDPTTWIGVSRHFNYSGNLQVNKHSIQFWCKSELLDNKSLGRWCESQNQPTIFDINGNSLKGISREMVSKSKKEVSEGDNKYRPLALVLAVLYRCYLTWRSCYEIEEVEWTNFINVEVRRRVSKNSKYECWIGFSQERRLFSRREGSTFPRTRSGNSC